MIKFKTWLGKSAVSWTLCVNRWGNQSAVLISSRCSGMKNSRSVKSQHEGRNWLPRQSCPWQMVGVGRGGGEWELYWLKATNRASFVKVCSEVRVANQTFIFHSAFYVFFIIKRYIIVSSVLQESFQIFTDLKHSNQVRVSASQQSQCQAIYGQHLFCFYYRE